MLKWRMRDSCRCQLVKAAWSGMERKGECLADGNLSERAIYMRQSHDNCEEKMTYI